MQFDRKNNDNNKIQYNYNGKSAIYKSFNSEKFVWLLLYYRNRVIDKVKIMTPSNEKKISTFPN
jgi:hypothetical protein